MTPIFTVRGLAKIGQYIAVFAVVASQFMRVGVVEAQSANGVGVDGDIASRDARLATGQRIYREGIGTSGESLKAMGAAQTELNGKMVACVTCHRRSGFGTSEGRFTIRPITGPALFEEQTVAVRSPRIRAQLGSRQRPPYSEALLARAIRGGIDSAGKPLDPVMPRYEMDDDDLRAVSAYLTTLSAQPSPGVDAEEIHFATVVQPGVSPERRRAMLDVMHAFIRDKGANVRSEERRRDAGTMRMYRAYRKWVLHVWDLSGPSESWGAQLESFYRQQPVFAMVGGLGSASWRPIHEFGERFEIPIVFAQTGVPVVAGFNNYNFYFSKGVQLEAEILAKYLLDKRRPGKIAQVYRRSETGSAAAVAFRNALPSGSALEDHVLEGRGDEAFWRTVRAGNPDVVVLWLGASDLRDANTLGVDVSRPVYLSFESLGGKLPPSGIKAGQNIRLLYPSDLPPKHEARLLRSKIWLHNKGISVIDESVQINTLFAMTVLSDAIGHIADSFSRDYFAERIEHVVSQTPTPSLFQTVSLGPGQRFAAKGGTIVQVIDGEKITLKAISGWIVP